MARLASSYQTHDGSHGIEWNVGVELRILEIVLIAFVVLEVVGGVIGLIIFGIIANRRGKRHWRS